MSVNDKATNITGTVANPSNPSVKLTALEDPTIINKANGIKNKPKEKTIFLNLFSIHTIKLLGKIYFGRDFDLCSEGVMKCPGG